jgi:hypothetical protein
MSLYMSKSEVRTFLLSYGQYWKMFDNVETKIELDFDNVKNLRNLLDYTVQIMTTKIKEGIFRKLVLILSMTVIIWL